MKLPNLPLQFKFLILFRFITTVGMQMKMTILGYFLFKITKEPLTLGYLGLYEAIPRILMSLPAGYIVERMEKRKALMIVVFTYFISTLSIALSMYFLNDSPYLIPLIFVIILIMGLVGSLGPSASVSIFSHIISKENTPRFAAINSNVWQIGAIVGPIIGGYLIHVFGETVSMFSVAAILSISILSVLFIEKIPSLNKLPFNLKNSFIQIREGLDFVFNNKILLWAISLDLFAVLFGGAVALLPVFAEEILHVGSQGYGWLKAAMPIGSAISMILLAARPLQKNTGKWLLFSIAMFGIFTLVFAVSKNIYLSLAMLFLMGAFDAVSVIIRSTLLILETPVEMKARVASVNQMFISSSNEIGAFESGFAAQYMGTVRSVIFGGSMTLFFVILAFKKAKALVNFEFINYKNDEK